MGLTDPTDSHQSPWVHITISISTAEPDTLNTPQHAVPEAGAHFEVGLLSCEEAEEMLELLLASDRKQISPAQWAYSHQSFPHEGQALHFQLDFQEARNGHLTAPLQSW